MNRKKFTGLIVMMILSVIIIIWVQVAWIRNAINIQNESFNNAVAISLNSVANDIEASRRMSMFNNFVLSDNPLNNIPQGGVSGYLSIGSYSQGSVGGSINLSITNSSFPGNFDTREFTIGNKSFKINGDTSIVSDSMIFTIKSPRSSEKAGVSNGTAISTATATSRVYVRQNDFLDWVKKRANELQYMSDQMISELYQWEKTLELDYKVVDNTIRQDLAFSGIQTPYEYAIIKNGVVQEGSYKKSEKDDFLKSKYMVRLFPDNMIKQDLILSVIFPERTNYVFGYAAWYLGGSLIFSLFILSTFALSLYFIISQKKISDMKSDFINNMTHEFKTPIATISLAADTITNQKVINDEKSIRYFIGMIKKENNRMNKKVETILQIASLDKKEIDFRFENVSLHTLIEHIVETIDIQVQQKNGKIILSLDATEPVIYGDSEHLSNLINNLLDNAIKYSPESPEITVKTKNTDNGILFSVEDKGIGMTKAVQSKIFERFYRQNSGNIHNVKGFGLGLNYSRAIIEAHKGTIEVHSEPGKGSIFIIFLPFNWENIK
jgi:two-component system, OmpR family, phosphate regulon sensor histidine kinase PhoR